MPSAIASADKCHAYVCGLSQEWIWHEGIYESHRPLCSIFTVGFPTKCNKLVTENESPQISRPVSSPATDRKLVVGSSRPVVGSGTGRCNGGELVSGSVSVSDVQTSGFRPGCKHGRDMSHQTTSVRRKRG